MGNLFKEIKRRKVFRVAAIYAVVAWVLIQVADTIAPLMNLPESAPSLVLFLLIILFPIALFLAWAYEVTPDGVKPETGFSSTQIAPGNSTDRKLIYLILGLVIVVAGFQISDRVLFNDSQAGPDVTATTNTLTSSVMRSSIILNHALPRASSGIATIPTLTADGSRLFYSIASEPGAASSRIQERNLITGESRNFFDGVLSGWSVLSPDGQRLLMVGINEFFIASLQGTISQSISLVKMNGPPGEWLNDGEILYTAQDGSIHRKSLTGSLDEPLADSAPGSRSRYPHRLPGGQAFLFVEANAASSQVKVYDLARGESRLLIDNADMPRYAPSGHLVFIREGDLWAAAFNLASLDVVGAPVRVVAGIDSLPNIGAASYAFSQSGRLVYLPGGEYSPNLQGFKWMDRAGNAEEIPLPPGEYLRPALSPDGQAIALRLDQEGSRDIWVYDLNRQTLGRRTFSGNATRPIWSPDGRQLFYRESDINGANIWSVNADGTGQPQQVSNVPFARPISFSSIDGKLLYREGPPGDFNIHTLTYRDDAWISTPLINTDYNTWGAVVSPNGRWVAYVSDESGRYEIYVRPYPDIENGKWQISSNGGREPQWGPNGDELFFIESQTNFYGSLFSVAVDDANGFSPGTPQQLLEGVQLAGNSPNYDVSNDGERFLLFSGSSLRQEAESDLEQLPDVELVVVENWFEELKRLVPRDPQ